MENNILDKSYNKYLKKEITRSQLESEIYEYFLKNQKRTVINHWKSEDYEDFISFFYPKIKRSIDIYKDTGNTFDSFIYKIFNTAQKEYKIKNTSNEILEYTIWNAKLPDLYVYENKPEYHLSNDKNLTQHSKRILALILKCYNFISEEFVELIAPRIGMNEKDINRMIDEVRSLRAKKDEEIRELKEKTFSQYYRCIALENRLSLCKNDPEIYDVMKKKLCVAKERLSMYRKKLNNTRKNASNSQIAEVIGISKGTVDASLHKLKEKFLLN